MTDQLDGKAPTSGFPHGFADALIAQFVLGQLISVSGEKGTRASLVRLEGIDEVWELCFRRPRPGWRLLGRFLEVNVLVAFTLIDRNSLGNRYVQQAQIVQQRWTQTFGATLPFSAARPTEYITGVVRDEDAQSTD